MFSNDKKFIYIEKYKCGSRSIVDAIREYNSDFNFFKIYLNKIIKKISSKEIYNFPKKHATAYEYLEYFGPKKYNEFFKFAFSRNPFDIQVSLFHFMKEQKDHFQHEIIKGMSFDEYILWRCKEDRQLQKNFVVDSEGNIIVDFIGKLENINQDLNTVAKKLNLNYQLQHINRSNHMPYQEYYSKKTEDLIIDHFYEDFELFDYPKKILR